MRHILSRSLRIAAVAVVGCVYSAAVYANEQSFANWVEGFKQDAAQQGISSNLLERAFDGFSPIERVLELDRKQPEGTMSFEQYLDRVISKNRIAEGRRMLTQHRELLEKVSAHYGVQPRFIVALWGVETSYGSNTGGFSVIEALATLAYDGRRGEFFRKELLNALKIIDDGHISLDDMLGSWAGAMGQCQFMPSSFLAFAQDFNGDGKKDIWGDLEDVFASIAQYLSQSGWDDEYTWGRRVQLPANFNDSLTGRDVQKSLIEWQRLGVRTEWGGELPNVAINASVVYPDDDARGRAYLIYNNYNVLLKWNRSLYFATAVGILSDELVGR